jgi:hypothetical protein
MFFVSEEFLRKYEEEGEAVQTIDEAVPVGQELFEDTGGKKEHNLKERERSGGQKQHNEPEG